MVKSLPGRAALKAGALPFLVCIASLANAQTPTVTGTSSFSSGLYRYNYTITNNSPNELIDVAIHINSGPVLNLTAPIGYTTNYDVNLGLVDFLENTSVFATGTPVSGFFFDSPLAPTRFGVFDALTADSLGNSASYSGTTLAPSPEPGSLALMGAAALSGAFLLRRKRAKKAS